MDFEKLASDVMERVLEKLAKIGDYSTRPITPAPTLPEPKGVAKRYDEKLTKTVLDHNPAKPVTEPQQVATVDTGKDQAKQGKSFLTSFKFW
jgi:hypothetical protein